MPTGIPLRIWHDIAETVPSAISKGRGGRSRTPHNNTYIWILVVAQATTTEMPSSQYWGVPPIVATYHFHSIPVLYYVSAPRFSPIAMLELKSRFPPPMVRPSSPMRSLAKAGWRRRSLRHWAATEHIDPKGLPDRYPNDEQKINESQQRKSVWPVL